MKFDLKQEWENITNAPIIYVSSLIVIGGLFWLLFSFIYKVRLSNADSSIKALDKQLLIYKDKKYIIGETTYSKLTDLELIQKSNNNLEELKKVYVKYKTQDTKNSSTPFNNETRNNYIENSSRISSELMTSYDLNFKVNTILLREQLLLRMPKDVFSKSDFRDYEYPTNPLGFKALLDDFQMLVLSFDAN